MAKTIRRNFPVQGMGCAACVARVQGTIKNLQGVQECNVSLASNTAQVDFDPKSITAADALRECMSLVAAPPVIRA